MEIQEIFNSRSGKLLLINGYKFSRKEVLASTVRWRCCTRTCLSRVYTKHDEQTVVESILTHNHPRESAMERQSNGLKKKAVKVGKETTLKLLQSDLENEDSDMYHARHKDMSKCDDDVQNPQIQRQKSEKSTVCREASEIQVVPTTVHSNQIPKIEKEVDNDLDAIIKEEPDFLIEENSSSINEDPGHVDEVEEPIDKKDPTWMEPSSPILNGTSTTSSSRPPEDQKPRILKNERTEFDVFGKSVAAQLNSMQWEDAIDLQLQVQQLMTQYRLLVFRRSQEEDVDSQGEEDKAMSHLQEILLPSSMCNVEMVSVKEEDFEVTY